MSESVTLETVKDFAAGLSMWAHIATVGADNRPDVVPVHPCWEGDVCWLMVGNTSVSRQHRRQPERRHALR